MEVAHRGAGVGEQPVLELSGNDRFPIKDPDAVWIVQEGTVDLFVQDVLDPARPSALAHLFRVTAGEAVFGLTAEPAGSLIVIACPSPGAKLVSTSQAELRLRARGWSDDSIVRWIDVWIAAVGLAACGGALPPASFTALDAEQAVPVDERPRVVAPRHGVLWVSRDSGSLHFLGRQQIAPAEGVCFPVSHYGWLEVGAGSVRTLTTGAWLHLDRDWSALRQFHQVALTCIAANRTAAEDHERARLRVKAEASFAALQSAMWRLAKSLRRRRAEAEYGELDADPLLGACRVVGTALGVRLVPPPGWAPGAKYNEPVEAIARASAVRVRRVLLRDGWWKREVGPLLGFREADSRPVALLQRRSNRYQLYDPVERSATAVDGRVAATLGTVAYTFYRPFPEKPLGFCDLLWFGLAGCRRDLGIILAMGLAGGVLSLAAPIAMGIIFDTAIPGAQRGQVVALAAFVVVAAISTSLFTLTRNFATLRLQGRLDATLQAAAWDRLLRLPVPFFREYSSGDLAVRSLAFNDIRQVLAGPVLSLIVTQLFSLLSFGLLFMYSVELALIASVLVAIASVISAAVLMVYVRHSRKVEAARGRVSGITAEFVQGITKFRVSGSEAKALAVWARETGDRKHFTMKASRAERALVVFQAAWPVVCYGIIFLAASRLIGASSEPGISTGSFLAFLAIFTQVVTAGLQFAHLLFPVLALIPVYERARPLLAALPEVSTAKAPPGELTGAIEVNHLTFRYSADGPLVLRDLSLRIAPGEMVAIVGQSGCGKSTLFRLLLGFEKPESGSVYYDRQDLAGLDLEAVRRQIGVVLQSGKLGSGTLLNIIVGATGRSSSDAWEAARMTGLDQDIAAMPLGIHTMVSDAAGTLSGGQRQRLMIARAIVNRPRILLFDEATSALDNHTQALVTRSLESLHATRLVIAHRLSTIVKADRILVLDKGAVVQAGTYSELMEQQGLFRDLASRQVA